MPNPLPYIVNGTIINQDGTAINGVNVMIHNLTTDERMLEGSITDSLGHYVLDLQNLPNGYSTGDSINVYVRTQGYVGEGTFTISGENKVQNITVRNQVTTSTLRNNLWNSFVYTITNGSFAISNLLTDSFGNLVNASTHIHSAMNDTLISSEGYPQIIVYPPVIGRKGITIDDTQIDGSINIMIEIYHSYSEGLMRLTDDIEDKIWKAMECWNGLGLYGLDMPNSSNDWWTEGNKKIHRMTINCNFQFDGVVDIQ
jgi:hypothetical protein